MTRLISSALIALLIAAGLIALLNMPAMQP